MKVLDLFSGLGGWSSAFRDRGHSVTTLDLEEKFEPDIAMDILDLESIDSLGKFDIVLASPPCQSFSIACGYLHHWKKSRNGKTIPQTRGARLGQKIATKTFYLLENTYSGKYYVIENPRGYMRHVIRMPDAEINYCAYGMKYKKPTDLWGNIPPSFNSRKCIGDKCEHVRVKHSWDEWGTNGIRKDSFQKNQFGYVVKGGGGNSKYRSLIPYNLSLEMCIAAEKDLGANI